MGEVAIALAIIILSFSVNDVVKAIRECNQSKQHLTDILTDDFGGGRE